MYTNVGVVEELLPIASPSNKGLADALFMSQTTRWVELMDGCLLTLVKTSSSYWERDCFMSFGMDPTSISFFNIYGGVVRSSTSGPSFKVVGTGALSNRIKLYMKDDSLFLYYKSSSAGDILKVCVISTNTDISITAGIDPSTDESYHEITLI